MSITVNNLSKTFRLYHRPLDRLMDVITTPSRYQEYTALKNISFSAQKGQVLGILGRNGAGKSTLLKLLTGILIPDHGHISIAGRLTGLLELGTGFNPEMSGIKNIRSNGIMLGITSEELRQAEKEIIEFSELGIYIHEPLKTYSSGMIMRLAFSIAIHAKPDCFLVDEALSVGDGYFQQKCMKKIRQFKEQGGTIIFVSHDLNAVKVLCDQAIVLEQGEVIFEGNPEDGVNVYNRIMASQASEHDHVDQGAYGTGEAIVSQASIKGEVSGSSTVTSGEPIELDIQITAYQALADITLGFLIRDRFGQDIFGSNTHLLQHPISFAEAAKQTVKITFPADIMPGKYTITLALHSGSEHTEKCYWWSDRHINFEVAGYGEMSFGGICRLPVKII